MTKTKISFVQVVAVIIGAAVILSAMIPHKATAHVANSTLDNLRSHQSKTAFMEWEMEHEYLDDDAGR